MDAPNCQNLLIDFAGGIATVTINRPARKNAIDTQTWGELTDVCGWVTAEPEVRVLVMTGAGDAFCSGADLSASAAGGAPELPNMRWVGDACLALHRVPQPTIARINGVAAGAGLNLALACDLTVASSTARFSEIFARRGLTVDFGGSWVLPRLIGLHRAKELVLFADIIDAVEAERLGLVNRVVPPEELDRFVGDWARRLAAGPPIALAHSKRLLNDSFARTIEEALQDEGRTQTINFATADTAEAVLAFVEKRDPVFRGR